MAATAPPLESGFNPYVSPEPGSYPQQFPPGQEYPPIAPQYVSPGQQISSYAHGTGFAPYGSPPMHLPPGTVELNLIIMPGWTRFTDNAVRATFIQKVYGIITAQLCFCLPWIALCLFEKNTQMLAGIYFLPFLGSFFSFFVICIVLTFKVQWRRHYPTNVILLSLCTISMAYNLGIYSIKDNNHIPLLSVGFVAGVCLGVTLFSFHSNFDFTSYGGVLFMVLWEVSVFGIIVFFSRYVIMTTGFAGIGAILFTLFSAYDIRMMLVFKKYEICPEEHIFAACKIFLDLVYVFIFLHLLMIFVRPVTDDYSWKNEYTYEIGNGTERDINYEMGNGTAKWK